MRETPIDALSFSLFCDESPKRREKEEREKENTIYDALSSSLSVLLLLFSLFLKRW